MPTKTGTNGFAIASFILGLIGGALLSVIFGVIALSQLRRRQQGGRGFAIAGLVLSGLWVLVLAGAIISAALLSANRASANGQITKSGNVSIFSLHVGDCFQNPSGNSQLSVTGVTAVPCSTAHNAQAFAAFSATGASYPGNAKLLREASRGCQSRESGDLDRSKLTSTMSLHFLFPEQQSWADGHRRVTCLVVDSAPDLTSSLLTASPAG
jgi:MFS family permease